LKINELPDFELVLGHGGDAFNYCNRQAFPSTRSLMICRAAAMSFELLSSLKAQRPS